ncbi:MAG TPA: SGNH/GDSL hydrolase family protein [Croceibacterium sp.]|jgi:lysophospholipase L1-like esterase
MHRLTKTALIAGAALAFAASPAEAKWVASWAASPHAPIGTTGPFAAADYTNVTLSQVVRITEGGDRLRVRFTNRYGQHPLKIGAARVFRIDDAGNEIAGTSRPLTFGGAASATIPTGAPFTSDAVALKTPDLSRLRVEFYLPEATGACTCHLTGQDELDVSPPGNFVGKAFTPADKKQFRAFLAGVDVDSPDALGTIVAYGDSITDGVGSTAGKNTRWPDLLADRLHAAHMEWAVANEAISGNRVLSPGMGDAALTRFDDDVLSLPNVKYMIVFEGVNDLGIQYGPKRAGGPPVPALANSPIDADMMIAGYKQLIERAHLHGIKVIGSPIGPYKGASYWSPAGEAARDKINDWIVHSGAFDGVIRLDTAFADPADPQKMREGYHFGDHLHGNDAGYKAAADSIDLRLFKP